MTHYAHRFGADSRKDHNAEVKAATEYLHDIVIPQYAASLDALPEKTSCLVEKMGDFLEEGMHLKGINCRHLGAVRTFVTSTFWRQVLLTEILARTVKNQLKEKMREAMKKVINYSLL